ncbi:hypothetical protein B0H13DRAFT_1921974 [Mycena leptocephala]|nr:hypothetical protein B0H13DRAFT_1921974 [Mycena leptocephala]
MPAGRPRLDPEIKRERRRLSRKLYEEKQVAQSRNAAKRREAARLGMSRHRAAIASDDHNTRRKYRSMANEHAENYRARKAIQEREALVAANTTKNKTRMREAEALRQKHRAVMKAPPAPSSYKSCQIHHYGRDQAFASICRVSSHLANYPNPSGAPPFNSGASPTRMHDFDSMSSPPPYTVNGDVQNHTGPFYAILSGEFRVVADQDSRAEVEEKYPNARTWAAPDWPTFVQLWALDCGEYHGHKPEDFTPPQSPAPSSTSSWNPTPTPSPSPSPPSSSSPLPTPPSLPAPSLPAPTPIVEKKRAPPLSKDDLAHLASFRNATFSPERLKQQFTRVLGPQSVLQPLPRELSVVPREITAILPKAKAEAPPAIASAQGVLTASHNKLPPLLGISGDEDKAFLPSHLPSFIPGTFHDAAHNPVCQYTAPSRMDADAELHRVQLRAHTEPLLYAVSGRNRVFQNRDRAVATFKNTPGADLLVTCDEEEAFKFLEEVD